jgi:hypothetical protein
MAKAHEQTRWTEGLEPEELNFIRRFVLHSGSLKDMAEEYGVSYPTIRARLDGLIGKIRAGHKEKPVSELRRVVRELVEEGTIDLPEAKKILAAGQKDVKDIEQKTKEKDDD